jgi:maleate cis-trans isomerase
MYAWRARLGVTLPSLSVVIEPEFGMMMPKGVTCHFQRFPFYGGRRGLAEGEPVDPLMVIEELKGAGDLSAEAAEVLTHVKPLAMAMA